jgi:hypothetical protein
MARPTLENAINYRTTNEVCHLLGLSRRQLELRLTRHIFPPPTFIDEHGTKFFDKDWMNQVRKIQEEKIQGTGDEAVP